MDFYLLHCVAKRGEGCHHGAVLVADALVRGSETTFADPTTLVDIRQCRLSAITLVLVIHLQIINGTE